MTPVFVGQAFLSEVAFQKWSNPDTDIPLNNVGFALDCKCKEVVFFSFEDLIISD